MFIWLDCLLKGIGRTIKSFFKTGDITPIAGCDLVEEEVIKNATVHICRCEHCKKYSISWEGKR
mgnify:CR=1 FL=1